MPRFDDHLPELDAEIFDREDRAAFDALLVDNEEMEYPDTPKRRGVYLECVAPERSLPGDYLTVDEVAGLLNLPVESVLTAMELRDGAIEGFVFRWITIRNGHRAGRKNKPRIPQLI